MSFREVAGAGLHHLDEGAEQAPLVLVHGSSTDATTRDPVVRDSVTRALLTAPDRPAAGDEPAQEKHDV